MHNRADQPWPLGMPPAIHLDIAPSMAALTIHRDHYGPPAEVVRLENVPTPQLHPENAGDVLVAVLATGPNFNTNFAALGLPVPVFGRGDAAAIHIPGSDALGIVVDAGPAVRGVRVGQAVILDSWTTRNIRGYETHDGFNAQFAAVPEERALPILPALAGHSPEQLAALLLTYGTAYRCIVERLAVRPGDSVLLMGGGKGTSFAGAQIARALGARVILMGSNRILAQSLIERGIAHAFVDRRALPRDAFGVLAPDADYGEWRARTEPFRQAVFAANEGRPVDKIFEHTGGKNFPLLVSALAPGGSLAFFGATGGGLKGEYKETFFYEGRRFVMDARWVWMRQKQVCFRRKPAREILDEMGLPPGRKGLVWGADAYSAEFVRAALERSAELAVIASRRLESAGIAELVRLGLPAGHIIDRDRFDLPPDMPDPLTEEGRANPAYGPGFMDPARELGRAVWEVLGPRTSPDFVVERPDQSTLHFSTFLVRDHDERDEFSCGWVVARGASDLSIRGSHMYRSGQAREVVRMLAEKRLVMEQGDLEITDLASLPAIQQKMLDGTMTKPKGVALVQADRPGRTIAEYEAAYLGRVEQVSDPAHGRYVGLHRTEDGVVIVTLDRPDALNALSMPLLEQLDAVVQEIADGGTVAGAPVRALLIRGSGRAFMAGADLTGFVGRSAEDIGAIAARVQAAFGRLESSKIPVVALVDGFALGGGNELAMSCHYRVVTENAQMGQPEVKLSMFPGYGGMQRLPRLVGPRRAAEMAVNGEPVSGRTAVGIGLADEFCPAATALRRAYQVCVALADGRMPSVRRQWDSQPAAHPDEQPLPAERREAGQLASWREELRALLAQREVEALRAAPVPDVEQSKDPRSARRYAARIILESLEYGQREGFRAAGLANDARLFGLVTAAPSGQYWIGRFLAKDPLQSSFLTLLPPSGL